MFIEFRKDFDSETPSSSIRQLLEEATVPVTYGAIVVRARVFGGTGSLRIFKEGQTVENGGGGIDILTPLSQSNFTIINPLVPIQPNTDPDWVDTLRIGRPSTNSGTQTLVLIIE